MTSSSLFVRHHSFSKPFFFQASVISKTNSKLSLRRYCAQNTGRHTETRTTLEFLEEFGFSTSFIHTFFHPFYGGIFLENTLSTSAAVFIYTFDRFSSGIACLPAGGMVVIPHQLASTITECELKLNTSLVEIESAGIHTADNQYFLGRSIILSTPFHVAEVLLGQPQSREWKDTRHVLCSITTTHRGARAHAQWRY